MKGIELQNKFKQVEMNKTGKGGFKKGESGNPGGRPKTPEAVMQEFIDKSDAAQAVIFELMTECPIPAIKLAAAKEWMDRGFGRPKQNMDVKTEVSAPISISFDGDLDKWSK